ncbi:Rhs element Vgr protein [Arcobacter nitrofigilis DSM 7299]|uniref:Rhs element Vgr protein n=1 Tax=Arcobacter nitrofigilis (strain ATCC 33309 / DSM 7299 / CCUG 15893 / LMG 7604 / NCTC 12251 / CI) TaxID=572480 RepID=D5V1H7_ARCNC|nr:type VI secretion system tip protein TssI/VgrG [Arcobacter nitrofigilis]ADG93411.1 Rhs element Vgr protein [Arcobacter nitrofigilis DSM 7299]
MSKEIIRNNVEEIEEGLKSGVNLKELRREVKQDINARIKLLNYKPNATVGIIDGSFNVYKLLGSSSVNTPYSFTITFVSDDFINIEDIVDTDIELNIKDNVNPLIKKTIYGKIFKASEDSIVAKKHLYIIEVVSPIYYLSLNNKYEIFHNKKTSDIIVEIINRYNQLLNLKIDIKLDLIKAPTKEYTTQYNQNDLEFIQMLCEKEGYSLILDYSSNDPYTITLCELNEHAIVNTYSSTCSFNHSKEFKSTNYVQDFYDKDKPSLQYKIQTGSSITSSVEDNESTRQLRTDIKREKFRDKLNVLDESYYKDLNRYSKIDSQREYVKSNIIKGTSEELNINDSLCITLEDEKANKHIDSIILEVKYEGFFPNALDEYKQNIDESKKHQLQYEVEFTAIPKDIIYKPPYKIKKPKINSIQTAIVSNGNSNTKDYTNTIDVDEQGRIKVLFHFETNQITSCYLRLSNMFSGDGYGSQFLPRVNSEVIVSFINGDPDLPIIIGTLHNGENKNPYNLPKEKTKSFIKTHSIPQYEDKIGYNEIAFEDKRGDENLSLRAQKDMNTLVLNNEFKHIENNSKTIINNDKEETVEANSILTINKDYTQNIKENQINTVEKEKLTTVKEDYEIHALKDLNTIVKNDIKTIVEKDMITRVKGTSTEYIEKDVKKKYLENLFTQVGKDYRLDVQNNYHLKSNNIKLNADIIELIAETGVTLRCGGNVLTVNQSGIHLKSGNIDTTSSNGGVNAQDVAKPLIKKPLYEKIRVISLDATVTKQNTIDEALTFTATVEKYENDAWSQTTDLNETQLAQLQWYFIKNNDESDTDIITDNPTNDNITINGLTLTVNVQEDNIYKWGHAHCYVVNSEEEGYAISELERYLEVEDIKGSYPKKEEGKCKAILNVEEPRDEELAQIRWTVEGREESKYNGQVIINHNLKDEKAYEINFQAYIEGKKEDAANGRLYYDENKNQEVKSNTK